MGAVPPSHSRVIPEGPETSTTTATPHQDDDAAPQVPPETTLAVPAHPTMHPFAMTGYTMTKRKRGTKPPPPPWEPTPFEGVQPWLSLVRPSSLQNL